MSIITENKIYRILTDKIEPWATAAQLRWVMATKYWRDLQLCDGVEMTPRKSAGKPTSRRLPRSYRNVSTTISWWKNDNLHAQRSLKLLYILSGCADLKFYDYQLRVSEHTFLSIPAGIPSPIGVSHIIKNNPIGSCEICWIQPLGEELHFWICYSKGETHTTWQWGNILFLNRRLTLFLQLLNEEILSSSNTAQSLVPHLLHLLIAGLRREANLNNYLTLGQEMYPDWNPPIATDPIDQAQQYIDAHYGSPITLEKLAHAVGVSRSLLALRFKEKTGMTVGEYLTQQRLKKAKELLCGSEWTAAAIGELVGFSSPNYFHKFFRRHEKCSPLQYRRNRCKR